MTVMPSDIYTEPQADVDALRKLGPLTPMAGLWIGEHGVDVHPTAEAPFGDQGDLWQARFAPSGRDVTPFAAGIVATP